MKKLLVMVLVFCFVLLCGCEGKPAKEEPQDDFLNFILNSDWRLSDEENCYSFGKPGVKGDYYAWDKREGKEHAWETGTYEVYTDPDGIVKEFARAVDECSEESQQQFDDQVSNLLDTIPFVLVIDIEGNDAVGQDIGMKTHFEYYGLHDDDNMVLIDVNSGCVRYLWRYMRIK